MMKISFGKKLLAVALAAASLGSLSNFSGAEAKIADQEFTIVGHRGARDLRPENTLAAFAVGMEIGVTQIELDTHISKDGIVMVSHNASLDPILARDKNGKWVTRENRPDLRLITMQEAKQYDVGGLNPDGGGYYKAHAASQKVIKNETVPTLEEVFQLVKAYHNNVVVNIEIKSYPDKKDPRGGGFNTPLDEHVTKVLDLVAKYGMQDRVTLQSFDWRVLQEVRRQNKAITIGTLTCERPDLGKTEVYREEGMPGASPWMGGLDIDDFAGDYVKASKAVYADYVAPIYSEVTPEFVAEAHRLGIKLIPWTVDNPADMERLIDMGVDGLISDRPDIVRTVAAKKGKSLPKNSSRPAEIKDMFPNSVKW